MGERDHRGARVEPLRGQRRIGPVVKDHLTGKTRLRAKGGAWIDDHRVIATGARHADQRLRDMHRAHDDHPQGRIVDRDKALPILGDAGPVQAKTLRKGRARLEPPAGPGQFSDQRHRPARRAGRNEFAQQRHRQRPAHRLDQHPNPPAAGQTHRKGIIIAHTELKQPRGAICQGLDGLGDNRALDAPTRDRPLHRAVPVDDKLTAHRARRRPPGLDHGGQHRAPPRRMPGQRQCGNILASQCRPAACHLASPPDHRQSRTRNRRRNHEIGRPGRWARPRGPAAGPGRGARPLGPAAGPGRGARPLSHLLAPNIPAGGGTLWGNAGQSCLRRGYFWGLYT